MADPEVIALLLGGGVGGGLMTKIVFDWLRGSRNGKERRLICPYNGEHAKAQLAKMDDLIREQATTNTHLIALVAATSDHFKESRAGIDRIISNIWKARGENRE